MPAQLTSHQIALQSRNSVAPRKTKKFCNRCGGHHAGVCPLVTTSRGTLTRVDLLATIEDRYRDRS